MKEECEMRQRRLQWFSRFATLALAATLAACGGNAAKVDTASEKVLATIDIGTLPIAGYSAVWIAQEKGYFKDEGLTVNFQKITDPSNGVANVVAGKIQFSLLTPGALAVALTQNVPLKVASPLYFSNREQGIFVTNDSPIKSIKDLGGKTMALGGLANNAQAGINIQLKAAGVDPKTVKPVLIPIGDTAATLLAGKVDAAQIQEPGITLHAGKIRPIIPDMFAPFGSQAVVSIMVTSASFASENPKVVAAFQRAMAKAEKLAQSNPDEVRAAIGKYTSTPAELLPKMTLPGFKASFDIKSQEEQAKGMLEQGFITKLPDMKAAQILNPVFAN
jgi:NitT/TauT family transport system substrate-binding protein